MLFLSNTVNDMFTADKWYLGLMFILAIIAVVSGIFFVTKYGTKKVKNKKEKSDIMKYSVLKDLESKGITQNISKDDIKKAKKSWKRIHRDHRLSKTTNKLEKKFK